MFDGQRTTQKFPRQVGAQLSRNGVQVGRIFVRVFKSRIVQWVHLKVQLASWHVIHIMPKSNESRTSQDTQIFSALPRINAALRPCVHGPRRSTEMGWHIAHPRSQE